MPRSRDQILKDALTLSATQRIDLIDRLFASLDIHDREDLNRLWGEESENWIEAYERGEIPAVDADAVCGKLRKR